MQAIETFATIDNNGFITTKSPLKVRNKIAKIIVLIEDDEEDELENTLWAKAISDNLAFNFLHDEAEDIYNENDGTPFHL